MINNPLYYPYIHIQDLDWLKGTLLLFPQVPAMDPGSDRETYFEQAVSDIFKRLAKDRANMSSFWRGTFGAAVAGATTIGSMTAGLVTGGAGLMIGVAARTTKSVSRGRKRAVESPLRYLTTMEKAGVVFRVI